MVYSIGIQQDNLWIEIESMEGYFGIYHLTLPEMLLDDPMDGWTPVGAVPFFEA